MKKIFFAVLFSISILTITCSPIKNLTGETFIYKSKRRTLELKFENDTLCRFKNTFNCKDIDTEIKEIVIDCKYKKIGDTIF